MGRTARFGHSSMGDVPSSPGTLGWEDLGTLPWDTWDMFGISQIVPGPWDEKDSLEL